MNIEIKKGDHVFIPGVVQREPEGEFVYVEYKCGSRRSGLEYFRRADVSELLILHPANGIKNAEPAPKHDTNRLFRKGDRVELKEEINGRRLSDFVTGLSLGKIYTVKADEDDCTVLIDSDNGLCHYSFIHLQLVTPVEEMGPYSVETCKYGYTVNKGELILATYNDETHPHAKEAAETECARLNAEFRKNLNND